MRVVITGSRHWANKQEVFSRLDELLKQHPMVEIAHGASPGGGVDSFVAEWGRNNPLVNMWEFPVRAGGSGIDGNWPYAGLKRNTRMLKTFLPDLVVGFRAAGKSNGTDHCLREAEKMNIDVEINIPIS